MKSKYLLAALAATVATPAMAQDMVTDFAGPRAEFRTGWSGVNIEAEVDGDSDSEKEGAVTFGGEVGFDAGMGGFVLGGYAGLDFGDAEFCEAEDDAEACVEIGRNFTIGVRGGVPLGGSALLYAKGGYSNSRLKASFDEDTTDDDDEGEFSESEDLDGFHLGAGLELAAGPNVYIKAEYVYTNYNGSSTDEEELDASFDIDRHQGLIGVGFRF